jgi:hypothetical protein
VGGEVFCSPALEQRGNVSPEIFEEITQRTALLGVKRKILHIPVVPTYFGACNHVSFQPKTKYRNHRYGADTAIVSTITTAPLRVNSQNPIG